MNTQYMRYYLLCYLEKYLYTKYGDFMVYLPYLHSLANRSTRSIQGFSKQVKQKVTETSLLIQPLEEEVTYTFMVRAQTIDFGPPISGNITTGPQEGSPMAPSKLGVTKTVSSVELQWTNGASGKGPILGYYIETRRKGKYICFLYTVACRHNICSNGENLFKI